MKSLGNFPLGLFSMYSRLLMVTRLQYSVTSRQITSGTGLCLYLCDDKVGGTDTEVGDDAGGDTVGGDIVGGDAVGGDAVGGVTVGGDTADGEA